jgi:ABC-type arginine/histidine transport system permease subunit
VDRRLSLYRRGDYALAADLFRGDGRHPGGFLAIGRVSSNKFIQFPIWLFTYIFRGTPLYVQLLVFYSGMYTLEIVKGTELLNAFFRSGLNCTVLALTLNTCAYTTEIFAGAIRSVPAAKLKRRGRTVFLRSKCIAALFCLPRCVLRCRRTATK